MIVDGWLQFLKLVAEHEPEFSNVLLSLSVCSRKAHCLQKWDRPDRLFPLLQVVENSLDPHHKLITALCLINFIPEGWQTEQDLKE